MDCLGIIQWPAMFTSVVAAWLVGSQMKQRRLAGFWSRARLHAVLGKGIARNAGRGKDAPASGHICAPRFAGVAAIPLAHRAGAATMR